MIPIREASIRGFKCFNDLSLEFGKLTLLCGLNGGGKSTVIQSMLLVSQGLKQSNFSGNFPLNGEFTRLGTVAAIVGSSRNELPHFSFSCKDETLDFVFDSDPESDRFLSIAETDSMNVKCPHVVESLSKLVFVGASRRSDQSTYPVPDNKLPTDASVGTDGRYAAKIYYDSVDDAVELEKLHPEEQSQTFRRQVNAWLSSLFPGSEVNVQFFRQVQQLGLEFRLSSTGQWINPSNIGYGLSYGFPIIVALLSAKPGQLVIIDSPEAHLHPYAQSRMGQLLAKFAQAGIQIFVETHSDHLLNGVRLAVKEGKIFADDVGIYFFSGAGEQQHGVHSLKIDSAGMIDNWPIGFFDQTERDLQKLIEPG